MENVVVKDVDGPNSNGWYEIQLEDGRKPTTKNEDVAKAAFQSRGSEVGAVISERVNGRFTNVYLNEIDGVKDGFAKPARKSTAAPVESKKDNERIARQWAYGRATELLIASNQEFGFPLDSKTMSDLSSQAEALLNATK